MHLEDNNYIIDGHFNYNLQRMSFSYELSSRKKLYYIKGFIKSNLLNFSNKTQLNIDTIKGKSEVSLYIEKMNNLFGKKNMTSFPLDLKGELNFSNNNLKFKNLEIISKNTNEQVTVSRERIALSYG